MLDWFYDTPIVRAQKEVWDRPVIHDNIHQYRKKLIQKRVKARLKRKKHKKFLKLNKK